MNELHERRVLTFNGSGGWLQRTLVLIAGAGLAIVAFFFITIALIAAAFIALAIGLRWWWVLRRLRAEAKAAAPLEGEYTVVDGKRAGERLR